jgi:sortase A
MLAVIALAVIGYPWLPAIQYQIFSHTPAAQPETIRKVATERPIDGNRVIIPKIGVDTPILEGSSLDVLNAQEGVWHQTGGQGFGNFVLAGHRFKYLPPNTSTLYSLDKLEPGDTIAVDWAGQRTIYQVEKLKTIGADDVSILNPTLTPKLTIYTCTDKKQTQRTVAIAVPLQNP